MAFPAVNAELSEMGGKRILVSVCYVGSHRRATPAQVGFHLNDGERIEAEIYDTRAGQSRLNVRNGSDQA